MIYLHVLTTRGMIAMDRCMNEFLCSRLYSSFDIDIKASKTVPVFLVDNVDVNIINLEYSY